MDMPYIKKYYRNILFSLLVIFVITLGIFLRFHHLTTEGLDSDELFSASVATQVGSNGYWLDFSSKTIPELNRDDSFLTWKAADNTPPLFEILLMIWAKLFGISDLSLRSLPAVLGTLVPVVFYLGLRQPLGKLPALMGVAFITFSPSAIIYSQEVRAYSLTILLSTIASVRLVQRILPSSTISIGTDKGFHSFWIDIAIYVLMAYSHYTGLFTAALLSALYLVFVIVPQRRYTEILKLAIVPLSIAPWIWLSWKGFLYTSNGGYAWAKYTSNNVWEMMLPRTLDFFLVGSGLWLLILWLISFAVAIFGFNKNIKLTFVGQDLQNQLKDPKIILALGLFVVVCVQFAYSVFTAFHTGIWHPRYFSVSIPLVFVSFSLLFSATKLELNPTFLISALILGLSVAGTNNIYHSKRLGEEYREASKFIAEKAINNSTILVPIETLSPYYNHYLRRYMDQGKQQYKLIGITDLKDAESFCGMDFPDGQQIFLFQNSAHRYVFDMLMKNCPEKLNLVEEMEFNEFIVDIFNVDKH